MDDGRRRTLRYMGLTGLSCLAGCQGLSSDQRPGTDTQSQSETSFTERSPASESGLAFETSVTQDGEETILTVAGEVTSNTQLTILEVAVGETSKRESVEGAHESTFSTEFTVTGGQSYEVTVTAETDGGDVSMTQTTEYVPLSVTRLPGDRLVGAHYYPWYEMHDGHENWTDDCVATPILGEYTATDRRVIDHHLTWCLEHGIEWLSVGWWGEGWGSERALSNGLLEAEKFDELSFSILCETTRLDEWNYDLSTEGARAQLLSDFEYLDAEYFSEPNYLHFDERPVVFFWVSDKLRGDVQGAFADVAETIGTEPYVLAGLPFGQSIGTAPITQVADGITSYNPYSAREDIEAVFHDRYEQGVRTMNLSARASDLDFVPVTIPGFNDTEIPDDQREDNPILSASPDRFERVCEQVQPHLDDATAVLVTSFNEWYENTQIEPSEQCGTAYLETVADGLATASSTGYDPDGSTLTLEFNKTVVPAAVNESSSDDRPLAFMANELGFYAGSEEVVTFDIGDESDEPIFLQGVYGSASDDSSNWRWFGGVTATTSIFVDEPLDDADRLVLRSLPMRSNEIRATVSFDGEQTDTVAFGKRELQTYALRLND